jgi:hypothetical protein
MGGITSTTQRKASPPFPFCPLKCACHTLLTLPPRTGLVYIWNNINDPFPDYLHLRPVPPREAFQPLIDSFRSLRRVAAPETTFVETDQNSGPTQPESGTSAQHKAEFNLWKAMCGLADLYLECGWDVNAVAQTDFRRVEFVEKRTKYLSEIIGPLEESVLEAGRHARQQQNLLNFADRGELDAVCILAGTDHAPLQAY